MYTRNRIRAYSITKVSQHLFSLRRRSDYWRKLIDIGEESFNPAIRSTSQLLIVFPTRYHPAANLYRARLNAVSTQARRHVQVGDTIIHDKSPAGSLA